MWPFTVVLGAILACATLIFWGFNEDPTVAFEDQIFATYGLVYGSFDPTTFTTRSERILLALTLFLLPVVLLNLLVSILGGSFSDCQDSKACTSSQTQIEYILEYIEMYRAVFPRSTDDKNRGYLISCGPQHIEEHDEEEHNERIAKTQEFIKDKISQIEEEMNKRIEEVNSKVTKTNEEIARLNEEMVKNNLEIRAEMARNNLEILNALRGLKSGNFGDVGNSAEGAAEDELRKEQQEKEQREKEEQEKNQKEKEDESSGSPIKSSVLFNKIKTSLKTISQFKEKE